MDSKDESMNQSGNINMSPTPFRGVMALEEEGLPSVPGMVETDSFSEAHTKSQDNNLADETAPLDSTTAQAAAPLTSLEPPATAATPSLIETRDEEKSPLHHPSAAVSSSTMSVAIPAASHSQASPAPQHVRSRKAKSKRNLDNRRHKRKRRNSKDYSNESGVTFAAGSPSKHLLSSWSLFGSSTKCCDRTFVRSTLSFMNLLARLLFWCSALASVAAVVWYSYELKKHG